jgi:SAM-dependent methyltransferase
MRPDQVRALYGGQYAKRFNKIWHESEMWEPEAGHHITTLTSLIGPDTRWLDVGCGTGWMLSRFPDTTRAGMDISPSMLAEARKANPSAEFFREGDIRQDVPEWHDAWDLVTCNGAPWSYLDTMEEIHQVARNLAAWTAPGGRCLMGIFDLEDYTGIKAPYPAPGEERWIDIPVITGVFWSFYDAGGLHQNMIAPSMEYWIDLFSQHFRKVEIVRWPHDPPFLLLPRRNLLASEKREPGDETPAEVVFHPVPELADGPKGLLEPIKAHDAVSRLQSSESRLEAGLADPDAWATEKPIDYSSEAARQRSDEQSEG